MYRINKYKRVQAGLTMQHLFPQKRKGFCSCGCKRKLRGRRRRWFSDKCRDKALQKFYIIKGDNGVIRELLYRKQKGICQSCKTKQSYWEADHIKAVCNGGGGCGMKNFQTLCKKCHDIKTIKDLEIRDLRNSKKKRKRKK